jgi:hypothetical protein
MPLWDIINETMTAYMRRQFFIADMPDKAHWGDGEGKRHPICKISVASGSTKVGWVSDDIYQGLTGCYWLEGPWKLRDHDMWFDGVM